MLTGYYGDADIPLLMADFGVAVAIAGFSPSIPLIGIKDEEGKDTLVSQGVSGVSATDILVHIQTSTLPPNLRNRTALTVDGVSMRIKDTNKTGDGAVTKILCEVVK